MKLGRVQQAVLEDIRHFGSWSKRAGWVWDTPGNTQKVLDTLVKRGLVKEEDGVYTPVE